MRAASPPMPALENAENRIAATRSPKPLFVPPEGMRDGPLAGLHLVDGILNRGELQEYRFAHATRAELCRRLGRTAEARTSFERALKLTKQEPERRFLESRLADLGPRM